MLCSEANSDMLCGKSCSIIISFFMVVLYNINIEERYIVQRPIVRCCVASLA